eukprot:CAMPEP_0181370746 /NCGR_PEP_ID=MMETSP1106-20121128/13615_1 /TAXON_ID=81844 /ORGANISM="Mantoniella antarctica, Strain SL-175" /LENGTH=121 /DNA_ID=CAMNT_0023487609 /DNA_START=146 /DNA_END=512 /DNA_ORIENTATION=+
MSSAAATSSSHVSLLVSGATGCLRRPSSQRSHAALMTTASARKKQGLVSLVCAPRAASGSSSSYGETSREGKVPRHNVSIGGYNPTGGDESMDEAASSTRTDVLEVGSHRPTSPQLADWTT